MDRSSSKIMKPERGWLKDWFAVRQDIPVSQDIPRFILSAASLGFPGISIYTRLYTPPSSDPEITREIEMVRRIEIELEEKANAYWKLEISDIDESEDYEMEAREDGPLDDYYPVVDDESIDDYYRYKRAFAARNFREAYNFVKGKKYCISSDDICSWESDRCYDSTWIAVHGVDSVCMITSPQHVDMKRVNSFYQNFCTNEQTKCSYASTILSEVEFLPYDDDRYNVDNLFRQYGHIIKKPFAVVCVVSDTKKAHEESGHEASSNKDDAISSSFQHLCLQDFEVKNIWNNNYDDVRRANIYLRQKLTSGKPFTNDYTVQTAIGAFQHLYSKDLKAEDIWVSTLLMDDNWIEPMHIIQREQHLAMFRGNTYGVGGFTSDGRVPRSRLEYWHVNGSLPYSFTKQIEENGTPNSTPSTPSTPTVNNLDYSTAVEGMDIHWSNHPILKNMLEDIHESRMHFEVAPYMVENIL